MTKVEQAFALVLEVLENSRTTGEEVIKAYQRFTATNEEAKGALNQLETAMLEHYKSSAHDRQQNHEEHERFRSRLARLEKGPAE